MSSVQFKNMYQGALPSFNSCSLSLVYPVSFKRPGANERSAIVAGLGTVIMTPRLLYQFPLSVLLVYKHYPQTILTGNSSQIRLKSHQGKATLSAFTPLNWGWVRSAYYYIIEYYFCMDGKSEFSISLLWWLEFGLMIGSFIIFLDLTNKR